MFLGLLACCAFIAAVYVTGVHDASNSVAVPVRTRALGERSALYLAALFNVLGVIGAFLLLGEYSASWVSDSAAEGFGSLAFLPHIFGATLLPLFYLPPLIFLLSWLMVVPFYRLVVGHNPRLVNQHAREVLAVSASAISLLHGLQTGYLYLLLWALLSERIMDPALIQSLTWGGMLLGTIIIALSLGAGTLTGGRRIGYTFAYKMVRLDPFRGAVAQGTTAVVQVIGYFLLQVPFSSSHLATASALGAGVNQRFNALKSRIVLQILLVWLVTIPACFVFGVLAMVALQSIH